MDSVKIISHVSNYQSIGNESLVDIAALKKKYPWFATLHILEAKCLKNENKFGLKKSIKTASLFAGDREVLYDFIHDDVELGSKATEAKPTIAAPLPSEVETKKVVESKPIEPQSNDKLEEPKEKNEPIKVETKAEPKPIVKKQEEKISEETVTEKEKVEELKTDSKQPLETETNEKSTNPAKDKKHEVSDTKIDKPTILYDPLVELQSKVVKGSEEKTTSKPKIKVYDPLVELPKLEKEEKVNKPGKQDFYSWLDSLEEEEAPAEPKPRKLKMSAEASQLLENFIKNRPNISRIRTDIDRTEIHKVDNENTGFELVTESLALLHIKQGRPEKAIEIYEKLRLQNPQKFSYFAALIEKTKKENNLE